MTESTPAASDARPESCPECNYPPGENPFCRYCEAQERLAAMNSPARPWERFQAHGDHPYTDPGDGRVECETCGKWVWLVTHSCKGVPVTEAAWDRALAARGPSCFCGQPDDRELVHRAHACEPWTTQQSGSSQAGEPRV